MASQGLVSDNPGWDSAQLIFMQWLVLSDNQRRELGLPLSERELALKLNVSDRTLRNWKNLPGFRDDLSLMALQLMYERLPKIAGASLENMMRPEGWQERGIFFRYVLPALQTANDAGLLDRVKQARNNSQLPRLAAHELLSDMSPEQRAGALLFLERASLLETDQAVAGEYVTEGLVASLDDIADPEKAQAIDVTPPAKQNKGATRSYSKRNVKPLR